MIRVRIFYLKCGDLIYTSNLDIQKIWEQVSRRSSLSLAYSAGFHPQARIQQACPLPLGFSSKDEIVDIWLEKQYSVKSLQKRMGPFLPHGIQIKMIKQIEISALPMQNLITAADYEIAISEKIDISELKKRIHQLMNLEVIQIEKNKKNINLRPRINSIDLIFDKNDFPLVLHMQLKHISNAYGRPDDVLTALGLNPITARIIRTKIYY